MGSVGMKEHHWGNSLIREWCSCIKSKQQERRGSLIRFALTLMAFFVWILQYKLQHFSVHTAVFCILMSHSNLLPTLLDPVLRMTSHRYCFPGRPSRTPSRSSCGSSLTILVRSHSVPSSLIPSTDSTVSHLEQWRLPFTQDAARWLSARQADRWGLCNPCALMERINWVSF